MTAYRNSLCCNLDIELDNNPQINGLEQFKRQLENDYFSDAQVRDCCSNATSCSLIIELSCGLSLHEAVLMLDEKNWGMQRHGKTALQDAVAMLQLQNELDIKIEEFTIHLRDTSIIIKRIYPKSIEEQLCKLLHEIAEHYIDITKASTETPYEIYIPVFEEDMWENDIQLEAIERANNNHSDYFSYWALYFESEDDATIYELSERRMISGELHMLDH